MDKKIKKLRYDRIILSEQSFPYCQRARLLIKTSLMPIESSLLVSKSSVLVKSPLLTVNILLEWITLRPNMKLLDRALLMFSYFWFKIISMFQCENLIIIARNRSCWVGNLVKKFYTLERHILFRKIGAIREFLKKTKSKLQLTLFQISFVITDKVTQNSLILEAKLRKVKIKITSDSKEFWLLNRLILL